MNWSYYIYGLGLVADQPIPGLRPVNGLPAPDLEISLKGEPSRLDPGMEPSLTLWHVSANLDARGEPVLRVWLDEEDAYFRQRWR